MRNIEAGQTIFAGQNSPTLFVIAEDLSRMQIITNVNESKIGRVREKIPVRFTVQTYREKTFVGEVAQIRLQPKTISNVVNYTVVIDAENNEGLLLPGMTATADLIVGGAEEVLLVPNSVLQFTSEKGDDSEQLAKGNRTSTTPASKHLSMSSSLYIMDEEGRPDRVEIRTGLSNAL